MSRQPTPPQLLLENQLCFLFHRISRDLDAAYRPLLSELGLTYPQYLVMLVLWEQDGLAVGQLGERLKLDSDTLTPLLKRLEVAGHLKRLRDTTDERRLRLQLTPKGRALRAQAAHIPEQLAAGAGCGLDELADLTRRIATLRDRIHSAHP